MSARLATGHGTGLHREIVQKVADIAEDHIRRSRAETQFETYGAHVDETNTRVTQGAELAEQRALSEALAEERGCRYGRDRGRVAPDTCDRRAVQSNPRTAVPSRANPVGLNYAVPLRSSEGA